MGRRFNPLKWCWSLLLLSLLLWVFTGEIAIFYYYSFWWAWPTLPKQSHDSEHVVSEQLHRHDDSDIHYYPGGVGGLDREPVRLLIISDPHIMCTCDREESWLARWDSDLYLKRSFSSLSSSLSPSLTIILGDVFADGFRASQQEWLDYLQCLKSTFSFDASSNDDVIVAMGDNDIGGEGGDRMSAKVNQRYSDSFGGMNKVLRHRGIQIVKLTTVCFINSIPKTHSESECREELTSFLDDYSSTKSSQDSTSSQLVTIVLSHVPLNDLQKSSHIKSKILTSLRPRYVFSGHIHHQRYVTHHHLVPAEEHREGDINNDVKSQGLTHEITVPTCSYRMGERSMAVGAAVIGGGGDLVYRVLWLPPRYPFIASYAIHTVLLVCLAGVLWCKRTASR